MAQVTEAVPPSAPAPDGGGSAAGPMGGGGFMGMLPFLMLFGLIMYFFTIRPQQKRERERQEMLNAISKGDEVITAGGICGTVARLNDNDVVLQVDDNVKIKFLRSSIANVVKTKEGGK